MSTGSVAGAGRTRSPWRRAALITAGFAALYGGYLLLPRGQRLSHLDFLVTGPGSLQFCDAANPRFLPVVEARSPVAMTLWLPAPGIAGRLVRAAFALRTATGKPIGPDELETIEDRKMQLLVVDPGLAELHQEVPEPGRRRGEWRFEFVPRASGDYRVFADFTPKAADREMYVSGDVAVAGPAAPAAPRPPEAGPFVVTASARPIYARQPVSFTLGLRNGAALEVRPLDGAWGRLTIVDEERKGLAYLHPAAPGNGRLSAPVFRVTLSDPGRYAAWATVDWRGRRTVVPFRFDVQP